MLSEGRGQCPSATRRSSLVQVGRQADVDELMAGRDEAVAGSSDSLKNKVRYSTKRGRVVQADRRPAGLQSPGRSSRMTRVVTAS